MLDMLAWPCWVFLPVTAYFSHASKEFINFFFFSSHKNDTGQLVRKCHISVCWLLIYRIKDEGISQSPCRYLQSGKTSTKYFLFQQVVLSWVNRTKKGRVGFFFLFYYKWLHPIYKWIRVRLAGVLEMRYNSCFWWVIIFNGIGRL